MELVNSIRDKIREFLQITESNNTYVKIETSMTHPVLCAVSEVMYRSDPYELEQCFKGLNLNNDMFWAAVPSKGRKIRKKSSHLYPDILDRHNDILLTSMNEPEFDNEAEKELFDEIFDYKKGQSFHDVIKKLDLYTMMKGDAFIKVTIDTKISEYPIIEVIPAEKATPVYKRNILDSIIFYTEYKKDKKSYILKETYGKGFIKYKLFNENDKEVSMDTIPELKDLEDIEFAGDFIMAVYLKYWDSPRFEHRGNPLITDFDSFDSLDEVLSLWSSGIRKAQPNRYIPNNMIPRDSNGNLVKPNPFDNDFIATNGSMTEGNDKIEVSQPSFDYSTYETTYVNFLQECCRSGKISPVSLATDKNKYEDNATADRQKEKMTEWTRSQRIEKLEIFIPEMIDIIFKCYANMTGGAIVDTESEITFDEFSSPNLEDVIDVLSKAAPGTKLISNKTIVDITARALDMDEDWKEEELKALADESGYAPADEAPLIDSDFNY